MNTHLIWPVIDTIQPTWLLNHICQYHNSYYMTQNAEIKEERFDDRSVDDLLLFINSGDEGTCLS